MIPTSPTKLSFWEKFFELHYKMMFVSTDSVQNHMYSSEPFEWPLMSRGIAYWVSSASNVGISLRESLKLIICLCFLLQAQIHLLGNIVIWYSATLCLFVYCCLLIFYLLRRRRQCYDLDEKTWIQFQLIGEVFLLGYLFHYFPYFFIERTLFLHHYIPAFAFKILLLAATLEHIYVVLNDVLKVKLAAYLFISALLVWLGVIIFIFNKFSVLSYGTTALSTNDVINLRWKETWDFIVHKN